MLNEELQKFEVQEQKKESTNRFLKFIFNDFQSGFVEFRYLSTEKRRKGARSEYFSTQAINLEKITPYQFSQGEKQIITFGPAPRLRPAVKPKKISTDADVDQIGCIWADLNYEKTQGGIIEVIERIYNLPIRPSIVINSGRGRQIYFVLKTPLQNRELLDWKVMMDNLRLSVESNVSKFSPSSVLPLPGFSTLKDQVTEECTVCEEESSWIRYSIEEVKMFLSEILKTKQSANNNQQAKAVLQINKQNNRTPLSKRESDWFSTGDSLPPGYKTESDGSIWLITPPVKENREPKTTFVSSSPFYISEIRENIDNGQISVVVSFKYLDKKRSTTILRSQMCNARSLVTILSGEGAPVTSNNARAIVSYLADYEHSFAEFIPRKQVTARFGRGTSGRISKKTKFFLPGLASSVEFAPNSIGDNAIYQAYSSRQGTLNNWVEIMNRLEEGSYMIPQIAVIASFVPPLQNLLQIPNFIVDIHGSTSSGKSTTLKLAASVYGRPFDPDSLILQWMNTKLAVEQIAGMCSELPIYLDDAQHCSDDLKRTVIYMIANGKGKARGSAKGGIKETMSWQTVALSSSEEPLHQSSPHEGVRGRLLPIGGIVPPFPPNSSSVVQSLEKAITLNHGFAGETFIRHLNDWNDRDSMKWQKRYALLRSELTLNSSSDIVGRVSGYIAAIGVASEIICPLLGLRFKPDIIVAWLLNHIQEQQTNQNLVLIALRTLAEYYLSNLSLFVGTEEFKASRSTLQGISKKGQYIGFMRNTLETVFSKRKWSQTMMLNKMSESGVLVATESDRFTKKVSMAGVNHRLVCIKWSAILPDDVS